MTRWGICAAVLAAFTCAAPAAQAQTPALPCSVEQRSEGDRWRTESSQTVRCPDAGVECGAVQVEESSSLVSASRRTVGCATPAGEAACADASYNDQFSQYEDVGCTTPFAAAQCHV